MRFTLGCRAEVGVAQESNPSKTNVVCGIRREREAVADGSVDWAFGDALTYVLLLPVRGVHGVAPGVGNLGGRVGVSCKTKERREVG